MKSFLIRIKLKRLTIVALALLLCFNAKAQNEWKFNIDGAFISSAGSIKFSPKQETNLYNKFSYGANGSATVSKFLRNNIEMFAGIGVMYYAPRIQIKFRPKFDNETQDVIRINFPVSIPTGYFRVGINKHWHLDNQNRQSIGLGIGVDFTALPILGGEDLEQVIQGQHNNTYYELFRDSATLLFQFIPVFRGNFQYSYHITKDVSFSLNFSYFNSFHTIGRGTYQFTNVENPTHGSFKIGLNGLETGLGLHINLKGNHKRQLPSKPKAHKDKPIASEENSVQNFSKKEKRTKKKRILGIKNITIGFRPYFQGKPGIQPTLPLIKAAHTIFVPLPEESPPFECFLSSDWFESKQFKLGLEVGFGSYINRVKNYENSKKNSYWLPFLFNMNSLFIEPYISIPLAERKRHSFYISVGLRCSYNFVGGGGYMSGSLGSSSNAEFHEVTFYYPERNTITPSLDFKAG